MWADIPIFRCFVGWGGRVEKRDDDAEKVVESVVLTKRGLRERSIVNKILLNAKLSLIHVNLYGGSLMDFEVIIRSSFCE